MRDAKLITAKEFLLLLREQAISAYVLRKQIAYNKRSTPKIRDAVTLAHASEDAKGMTVTVAVFGLLALALVALASYLLGIGPAPLLVFTVIIAIALVVCALRWRREARSYRTYAGRPYTQLLAYLQISSGVLAHLPISNINSEIEKALRKQAAELVRAEDAVRANPHGVKAVRQKELAHHKMQDMFNSFEAMGLVPVPERGWKPYFEGLQPASPPKDFVGVPHTVETTT